MVKTIKYLKTTIICALLLGGWLATSAQDFPATPSTLVNDYTNTLSPADVAQLERKLVAFDDSTSTQIAVVVMQSTGQYEIADYAVRLAQQWGIGGKEHDNGILLLVALGDRAVTIQTGYGVEGAVPDAIAYRIIENEIKPAFRQGDYATGINRATDALIAYTKGEYKAAPKKEQGKGGGFGSLIFIVIIVVVAIAMSGRGGGGGGGRVMGGRGASDLLWWTLLSGMGRGGRGGGFGGGGGGFGGGGGGFGGFGGGGFGGGGASGSW
ncbi:TPM domain-containing protein [Parapedobacter sp. 10938]|uniref:TPM domain-containing protein n=1 Tax=Parapedobacter flavus TaxID=3110225 RepID=UPI002DBD468D|nr:TPM domain-containing protein [Parapedobacter sp. 10938]MEC3880015.1 TPM domain-containing protein [Parapedobacter sp. 10938]